MAEITKIEKLNGKNYQSWKYNIKLVLMERGLWGFTQPGQEIPPEAGASISVKNAFRRRSDKAYSLIALNVEKDLQVHISSVLEPLLAWEILQKQFEFVSVTQIIRVNRKFYAVLSTSLRIYCLYSLTESRVQCIFINNKTFKPRDWDHKGLVRNMQVILPLLHTTNQHVWE